MRCYLAGPMAGYEEGNFPLFKMAANHLRENGYDVVSPVEMNERDGERAALDPGHPRRSEFLARDVQVVADPTVEAVVVLPGWRDSAGARLEVVVAQGLGKPVLRFRDLQPIARETVLEEAGRLVEGARSNSYGHPADHAQKVAEMWAATFGWKADAYRVNIAMILFKIARADVGRSRDSLVDIAGYARTAEAVMAREGEQGFTDLGAGA